MRNFGNFRNQSIVEPMEPRRLLSSGFPNVNISRMAGSQAEGAIAVDPVNPKLLFAAGNVDVGDGLTATTSSDGGVTWSARKIATDGSDLPPACCDPSAAFDSFGNLFLTYLNSDDNTVVVVRSTDAGQTFSLVNEFHGNVDQPTITTGPGSVWLTFARGNGIVATGAADAGLGQPIQFAPLQSLPGSAGGNFGDIAIGASGDVVVTYQVQVSPKNTRIYINRDPGGLDHPVFGKPVLVSTTHVGDFDYIDAQPNRGVDAEAGLAIDRSGGAFSGRLYLAYTDENPAGSGNTDIFIRYSDDQGSSWSGPIRVNDDTTLNSQFLPRISIDNTTGDLAAGWYDGRNDLGLGGGGDVDDVPNDDAEYFATIIHPLTDGLNIAPNQQISSSAISATDANSDVDLGDYTGLAFLNGIAHPLWFDNSDSTADNPNGTLKGLNMYTAGLNESAFSAASNESLGGVSDSSGPLATLAPARANAGLVRSGRTYTISLEYSAVGGVSRASIDSTNLLITGPNGFSQPAVLKQVTSRKGGSLIARYKVTNPDGAWKAAERGSYTILLEPNEVVDSRGRPSDGGILGEFVVAVGTGKGSTSGAPGPRHHHSGDPGRH